MRFVHSVAHSHSFIFSLSFLCSCFTSSSCLVSVTSCELQRKGDREAATSSNVNHPLLWPLALLSGLMCVYAFQNIIVSSNVGLQGQASLPFYNFIFTQIYVTWLSGHVVLLVRSWCNYVCVESLEKS